MQLQRLHLTSNRNNPEMIGFPGEPFYWAKDTSATEFGKTDKIGQLYVINVHGQDFWYILKEYRDGWWKLEWPD